MTDTLTRELAALDDALAGRPVDPDLADLAGLAVALRDERPVPDPAFARSLDERAERGFPRARSARRLRAVKWPKLTLPALGLAAAAVLAVVLVLPGLRGNVTPLSKESREPIATVAGGSTERAPSPAAEPAPSGVDSAGGAASAPAVAAPSAALAP